MSNENKNKEEVEKEIVEENDSTNEVCDIKKVCDNKEEEIKEEEKEEKEEETVESVKNQYNALNEKYIRVYADFDNTKKRLEKDKYNAIDYAIESFSKDLLAVFDSLELALKSANSSKSDTDTKELLSKLVEGLTLTSTQFESVLIKNNIEKVETDGGFDPNIHNAIMQVDSKDGIKSGEIVEVLQSGYKLKERIIRPAMVSVAK